MKLTSIYVVVGSCGEYSDHQEWCVRAFRARVQADHFHEMVSAEARRLKQQYGDEWWNIPAKSNPLDPQMQVDSSENNYYLVEVPFEEETP